MRTNIPFGIKDSQVDHPDWGVISHVELLITNAMNGAESLGDFVATMLRNVIDDVIDTAATRRRSIDDLEKTEKTYLGTRVEILLRHRMSMPKGNILDLNVGGTEVDIKFTMGGNWMVPPEASGQVLLLIAADEARGLCWMGLIRATDDNLSISRNRDGKRTISKNGMHNVRWLLYGRAYEPNFWRGKPESFIQACFDPGVSGTERIYRLFAALPRHPIPRRVVQEVAQQLDFTRRVRQNGGARDIAGKRMIILSDYLGQDAVLNLNLPPLKKGYYMAVDIRDAREESIINASSQVRTTRDWAATRSRPKGPVNYSVVRTSDWPTFERTDDANEDFDGAQPSSDLRIP